MEEGQYLIFGPFRLDLIRDRLWKEQEVVELRAKPLAVLRYLAEHPGQVVTRSDLQKPVWGGTHVTKTALRVCLREIRLALGDKATTPQYIETVGRQGYRFIGQVVSSQYPVASRQKAEGGHQLLEAPGSQRLATDNWQLTTHFVGRQKELA
jgi:DNA-binding winged helix-turn-helix (wHTH) protein